MSLANDFTRCLDELLYRRTAQLRDAVVPHGRGSLPKFTTKIRANLVDELLDNASAILSRDAKGYLRAITVDRKLHHFRGRGSRQRGDRFEDWIYEKIEGPIIYAFWRGERCLYVGKGKQAGRLYHYKRHLYVREADCVEVFFIRSRSYLAQAECLAMHLYSPRDNVAQSARVRWGKKCPICEAHDFVRDELYGLFKMK